MSNYDLRMSNSYYSNLFYYLYTINFNIYRNNVNRKKIPRAMYCYTPRVSMKLQEFYGIETVNFDLIFINPGHIGSQLD